MKFSQPSQSGLNYPGFIAISSSRHYRSAIASVDGIPLETKHPARDWPFSPPGGISGGGNEEEDFLDTRLRTLLVERLEAIFTIGNILLWQRAMAVYTTWTCRWAENIPKQRNGADHNIQLFNGLNFPYYY